MEQKTCHSLLAEFQLSKAMILLLFESKFAGEVVALIANDRLVVTIQGAEK